MEGSPAAFEAASSVVRASALGGTVAALWDEAWDKAMVYCFPVPRLCGRPGGMPTPFLLHCIVFLQAQLQLNYTMQMHLYYLGNPLFSPRIRTHNPSRKVSRLCYTVLSR